LSPFTPTKMVMFSSKVLEITGATEYSVALYVSSGPTTRFYHACVYMTILVRYIQI